MHGGSVRAVERECDREYDLRNQMLEYLIVARRLGSSG
jgi:hypothetical protein